uniref:Chromo domain-containing protein n=1 Tax=Ditylenchus dipsaci TaxID=166011 RepID=A0A915CTD1_9BILA
MAEKENAEVIKVIDSTPMQIMTAKPIEQQQRNSDDSGDREYVVEKILDSRKKGNGIQYLVKWAGYNDASDNTWEPAGNLNCGKLIADFEAVTVVIDENDEKINHDSDGEATKDTQKEAPGDAAMEAAQDAGEEAGKDAAEDAGEKAAKDAGEEAAGDAGEEAAENAGEKKTSQKQSKPETQFYEVERIIDKRTKGGVLEYKVQWKGYSKDSDSWEPAENLEDKKKGQSAKKKGKFALKSKPVLEKKTSESPTFHSWDISFSGHFTLLGISLLRKIYRALQPATASNSMQHTQLWCINQGDVSVNMQLDRSGYTPGETILINGKIYNHSRRLIKSYMVRLIQHVCYRAKTFSGVDHTKETSKVVAKLDRGDVPPHSIHSLNNQKLVIPSITPRLSKCKIIEIKYTLELEAQSSAKTSLPIIIGTIPLLSDILSKIKSATSNSIPAIISIQKTSVTNEAEGNAPNTSLAPTLETALIEVTITDESGTTRITTAEETVDLDAETATMILPSPYYRESCFGRTNIADEERRSQYGENNFAPKYPFYSD